MHNLQKGQSNSIIIAGELSSRARFNDNTWKTHTKNEFRAGRDAQILGKEFFYDVLFSYEELSSLLSNVYKDVYYNIIFAFLLDMLISIGIQ